MAVPRHLKLSISIDPPVSSDPPTIVALIDGSYKPKSHTIKRSYPYAEEFSFNLDGASHWLVISVFTDSTEAVRMGEGRFDLSTFRVGDRVDSAINVGDGTQQRLMVTLECSALDRSLGLFGHIFKAVKGAVAPKVNKSGTGVERLVTVDVVAARGLPSMDTNGLADPYCRVRVGKKKHSTKTKFKTLNPEWRQRFEFALMDFGGSDSTVLQVDVLDRDLIGNDEPIGSVRVQLDELAVNVTDTRWWPLEAATAAHGGIFSKARDLSGTRAEICLVVTVADLFDSAPSPEALKAAPAYLVCHVHRAVGLVGVDRDNNVDPFVLIEVGNRRARTPTVARTQEPIWDIALVVPVSDVFGVVEISVLDEDPGGRYQCLGTIAVPLLGIKNGQAQWFALKSKGLHKPGKGYLLVRLSLEIQKPVRCAMAVISRREKKLMQQPDQVKLALLKSNADRARALFFAVDKGFLWLRGCFEWTHSVAHTVVTLAAWLMTCAYVQLWHVPLGVAVGILAIGVGKFRKADAASILDADAYEYLSSDDDANNDANSDDDETGDRMGSTEGPSGHYNEGGGQSTPPPGRSRGGGIKGIKGMKQSMRQISAVAKTVQDLLGELADAGERVKNLFTWGSPHITLLFVIFLLFLTVLFFFVSFRWVAAVAGINRVVRSGLKKYHPAFRPKPFHRPMYEVLEALSRVPSDVDKEMRRRLPVPDELKAEITASPLLADVQIGKKVR